MIGYNWTNECHTCFNNCWFSFLSSFPFFWFLTIRGMPWCYFEQKKTNIQSVFVPSVSGHFVFSLVPRLELHGVLYGTCTSNTHRIKSGDDCDELDAANWMTSCQLSWLLMQVFKVYIRSVRTPKSVNETISFYANFSC